MELYRGRASMGHAFLHFDIQSLVIVTDLVTCRDTGRSLCHSVRSTVTWGWGSEQSNGKSDLGRGTTRIEVFKGAVGRDTRLTVEIGENSRASLCGTSVPAQLSSVRSTKAATNIIARAPLT